MVDDGFASRYSSSLCYLPGYAVQLSESGVKYSEKKLSEAKARLDEESFSSVTVHITPCKIEDETVNYRCRCSFQLVLSGNSRKFEYAMRSRGSIKKLNCSFFPIASRRIQTTMTMLLDALNSTRNGNDSSTEKSCLSEGYECNASDTYRFPILREHLASVSFTSSWDERECLVTLHYSHPGLPSTSGHTSFNETRLEQWIVQAEEVRLKCNATNLSGRSRRVHLSVPKKNVTNNFAELESESYIYFHDEITLDLSEQQMMTKLQQPLHIKVSYLKPEAAFQHPNPRVMYQALKWLCLQMYEIRQFKRSPLSLLEMYCGYGAHTIPLCKARLCDKVVAVEIDERLAHACQANCMANQCSDVVSVVRADASAVSRSIIRASNNGSWKTNALSSNNIGSEAKHKAALNWLEDGIFDVVLVDPPRQGLGLTVCELLKMNVSFNHVLYISCGQEALVHDLTLLKDAFDIKELEMLDLFPRTDSVETLVHLQRIH
jgi:tRNA/tmRNA/rRNA uracil-C5-methylase (TrmA/RlmC/RlmD family)